MEQSSQVPAGPQLLPDGSVMAVIKRGPKNPTDRFTLWIKRSFKNDEEFNSWAEVSFITREQLYTWLRFYFPQADPDDESSGHVD
jgi:hypothetical protein